MFTDKFVTELNELLYATSTLELLNDSHIMELIQRTHDTIVRTPNSGGYHHLNYTFEQAKDVLMKTFGNIDPEYQKRVLSTIQNTQQYFYKIITNRHDKEYGKNYCGTGPNNTTKVVITWDNSPAGIITAGHECAHAIGQRSKYNLKPTEDCIGEIESLFTERLIAEELYKQGLMSEDEYQKFLQSKANELKRNCELMLIQKELFKDMTLPITKEQLEELSLRLKNHPKGEVYLQELMELPKNKRTAPYLYRYVIGEVVGSQLYEQYKKDKDTTLNKYYVFMDNNAHAKLEDATQLLIGEQDISKVFETYIQNTRNMNMRK